MKIQSRKFLPLMYQLAARLGTKSHDNPLFQGILNEVWPAFITMICLHVTSYANIVLERSGYHFIEPSSSSCALCRSLSFLLLAGELLQLKSLQSISIWSKTASQFAISQGFTDYHTTSLHIASQCNPAVDHKAIPTTHSSTKLHVTLYMCTVYLLYCS